VQRPSTRAPFLGRDQELAFLIDAFDEAVAGHGRLVLVSGEPGIGKTRLSDEVGRLVDDRGGRVVWGRAWADAGAAPFWPWIQALRAYLAVVDPETTTTQLRPFAGDIVQLLPELTTPFPELARVDVDTSEAARFRLFDSITRFLRVAASRRPLVIVLDDLQAMDPASIQLLRFVAGQLGGMRLLVVATYRDLDSPDEPGAIAAAALRREPRCLSLSLTGLPTAAIVGLLEIETGSRPDRTLVRSLAEATSGNPLFVGEAIRLLAAEGRLDERDSRSGERHIAMPASIQAVIGDRLARLPEATRDVLRRGAALGPEFDLPLLTRITAARADGDATGSATLDSLDPATRAGLVVDLGNGSFRFAHDLVRQSLYRELTAAQRFELHFQIAVALEAEPASIDDHLAELAFHFGEAELAGHYGLATPRIDPRVVMRYAVRASRQARATLAFEEAARLDRMALRILDDHPGTIGPGRLELLLDVGDAEARAGDLPAARRSFLAASAIAREGDAARELAEAALGYGGRFIWSRAGDDPEVVRLLEDALQLLEHSSGLDHLLVRVRARLACAWRSDMAHREASDRLSAAALEAARTLDDPATLTFALAGRFWATYWPENPLERFAIADELLAVARDAEDVERTYDGHQSRCAALLDLGRIREARSQVVEARLAAIASRQPSQLAGIRAYEVVLALLAGHFDAVESEIASSPSDSVINAIRDDVSTAHIHRFLLRRERGGLEEIEVGIRNAIETFPWYPYFRPALACLLLEVGQVEEARLRFEELAADDFTAIYPDCEWFLGLALAAEACSQLRDVRAAATLYEKLLPFAGRHAVAHAEGSMGAVDRYLGLLADVLGRVDEAARHFGDAVVLNTRLESSPWTGHTQADWADAILRSGQQGAAERAVPLLDAARAVADRHGMIGLRSKVDSIHRAHRDVLAGPVADHDVAGGAGLEPSVAAAATVAVFRFEGEYWTVGFDGIDCRLRDSKGMRYLAQLLADPGREFHVLDLVTAIAAQPQDRVAPRPAKPRAADAMFGIGDAGEVLDAEARRAYRERLVEIETDLAQARDWNDPERVALMQAERAALVAQLAAAIGLGGRSRVAGSSSERARLSVRKALRSTLGRIDRSCAPLGRHLGLAIRTGTFCTYAPDPGLGLTWDVGSGSGA
jgi:tetratricopeptide (TPR) repeat protein